MRIARRGLELLLLVIEWMEEPGKETAEPRGDATTLLGRWAEANEGVQRLLHVKPEIQQRSAVENSEA